MESFMFFILLIFKAIRNIDILRENMTGFVSLETQYFHIKYQHNSIDNITNKEFIKLR